MAEYIESTKMADVIHRYFVGYKVEDMIRDIRKEATADVAPVVHGEWVVCGDGDNVPWMCSHCGKTTAHKYKTMYGKYCPNCGAHMKDGE